MNIVQKKSPNITRGRSGYKPDIIVCHITEGSYVGAVSWLCNTQSQASTHFVVAKDGRVTQLVDIADTAWGNGTTTKLGDSRYYGNSSVKGVRDRKTSANNYTVSIEHEGFYKDAKGALAKLQLDSVVELIAHIRAEVKRVYGITIPLDKEHIVGHCHIAPRWKPNCPGQAYPFDEVINRLKRMESGADVKGEDYVVEKRVVSVNGKDYKFDAIMKDGSTFIKIREFEQAGYKVGYDANEKKAAVRLVADKKEFEVNGELAEFETVMLEGLNYIKLRELEKLGVSVDYDADKGRPVLRVLGRA